MDDVFGLHASERRMSLWMYMMTRGRREDRLRGRVQDQGRQGLITTVVVILIVIEQYVCLVGVLVRKAIQQLCSISLAGGAKGVA